MVDKYIKEILVEHGKVYVPKFGLISKNIEQTEIDTVNQTLVSRPSFYYSVDTTYHNEEDTWLIYAIARGEQVSLEDAEKLILDRVEEIKLFLEEGQHVGIEGVGILYNSSGNIEFVKESLKDINEEDSFGIPSYLDIKHEPSTPVDADPVVVSQEERTFEPASVPPEESNVEAPSDDIQNREEVREDQNLYYDEIPEYEREENKSKLGLIAAIVVFLLVAVGATYYFLRPSEDKYEELSTVPTNESYEALDVDTADSYSEEINAENSSSAVNKPLAIKEEGKRYYIIAGAFALNENAEKYKRTLGAKGLKSKVLKAKETEGLYRVSLADFEEFQEALTQTESFKKQYGNSLWILKY